MKRLLIPLLALALVSNAGAFSVAGHVSGGSGFALRAVMAIPVSFSTYYAAVAVPILNTYSFSDLPAGNYYLMAFQDVNGNQQPDISEPRGVYGGVFAQLVTVDQNLSNRNISIGTPTAGTFDGSLSYTGTQSNFSLIGVFDNPQCTGAIHGGGFLLPTSGNGQYFTFLTGPGTYYVYAVMDVNGNYQWDVSEPIGYYGGMARAPLVITDTNFPHDVNITMYDVPLVPPPPQIVAAPLDDRNPVAFSIAANIVDPFIAFSADLHYRNLSAPSYQTAALSLAGFPNVYAATLGPLAEGAYEYYVRAEDIYGGVNATAPDTFHVGYVGGPELAYDDGSAESFSWSGDAPGYQSQWAVRFTAPQAPFILTGARFAASRSLPDTLHSRILVRVYDANSESGLPGNLLYESTTGSVGNVIGSLPAGTNWAHVVFRDALGNPLTLNSPEFFISVANLDGDHLEAFGRDSTSANQYRSYLLDPCLGGWISEDAFTTDPNAHPGNRLIRATGFSLVVPTVVIARNGDAVRLYWDNSGAPYYRVYSANEAGSGPTWLATVPTNTYTDSLSAPVNRRFYIVRSSSTP
jgi:hypothetical protein